MMRIKNFNYIQNTGELVTYSIRITISYEELKDRSIVSV